MDRLLNLLLAEDEALLCELLVEHLSDSCNFIITTTASGYECIRLHKKHKPDVILLDIGLSVDEYGKSFNGIETAEEILKIDGNAKILFLSCHDDEYIIYHCYKAGGKGFVSKHLATTQLLEAITKVYNNSTFFPYNIELLEKEYNGKEQFTGLELAKLQLLLSRKEYEVFTLIGVGYPAREMADKLNLSPRTVETHIRNIKSRLDIKYYTQLSVIAARHILVYKIKPDKYL